jgi:hypothetical protein
MQHVRRVLLVHTAAAQPMHHVHRALLANIKTQQDSRVVKLAAQKQAVNTQAVPLDPMQYQIVI